MVAIVVGDGEQRESSRAQATLAFAFALLYSCISYNTSSKVELQLWNAQ